MSAFMLFASAMIATQVAALSFLVGDAIRRERRGAVVRSRRPAAPVSTYGGVERRRGPRIGDAAMRRGA